MMRDILNMIRFRIYHLFDTKRDTNILNRYLGKSLEDFERDITRFTWIRHESLKHLIFELHNLMFEYDLNANFYCPASSSVRKEFALQVYHPYFAMNYSTDITLIWLDDCLKKPSTDYITQASLYAF